MEGEMASCIVCSSNITWYIPNFSQLSERGIYSDIFIAGDCKWRLLMFPQGNVDDALSIYLDVADSEDLPEGWNRVADFSFSVINQFDISANVTGEFHQHVFNARARDWGFKNFIPLSMLKSPAGWYLVEDTLIVEAEVHVLSAVHSSKNNEKDVVKLEAGKAPEPAVENQTKDVAHVQKTRELLAEISTMRDKQNHFTLDSIQAPETINCQQQKEALRVFFSMSLKGMQQADCFVKILESLQELVKHSKNLREKMTLKNIISRLLNLKNNFDNAKEIAETAEARRTSLAEKTADVDSKLEEREKELNSLEFEFSTLSGEKEKLRAEIDKVTARMKSVSVKLERANEETCKEIEARRHLEAETKKVIAEWVGAKEKMASAKVHWNLLREDFDLAKLH